MNTDKYNELHTELHVKKGRY